MGFVMHDCISAIMGYSSAGAGLGFWEGSGMNRPAAPLTPSRVQGATPSKQPPPQSFPSPTKVPTPRRDGTDDVALTELRNAGATYDYLRKKGDPVQFWETLRLSRSRRAIV